MSERVRLAVAVIVLLGVSGAGTSPLLAAAPQRWKDRLRNGVDRVREGIAERMPELRDRMSGAAEGASRLADRVRDEAARRAPDIERKIRDLGRSGRDTAASLADRFGPAAENLGRAARERIRAALDRMPANLVPDLMEKARLSVERFGETAGARLVDLMAAGKADFVPKVEAFLESEGRRFRELVSDPGLQARALDGVVAALELRERLATLRDEALRRGLDLVGNGITVDIGGRRQSLNEWAGGWIETHVPFLRGTSIARAPIESLTYTFVAPDRSFILEELRIIPDGNGGARSIAETLAGATGLDPGRALDCLDLVEKTLALREGLATGEGAAGAALEFAGAVRRVGGTR